MPVNIDDDEVVVADDDVWDRPERQEGNGKTEGREGMEVEADDDDGEEEEGEEFKAVCAEWLR